MNSKNARDTGDAEDQKHDEPKTSPASSPAAEPGPPSTPAQGQAPSEPLTEDEVPGPAKEIEEAPSKKALRAEVEEIKSLRHKLKKKEHELKVAKKTSEELHDKYIRLLAEMENQRKRLDREKSDFFQFALADVLRELLSVLDNFERALQSKDHGDGKSFQEGVELIYRQFLDMVRRLGVKPVETENKKFDPALHQAVASEESDEVAEPVIGEVLLKGYKLNERLLRPAAVKVLVPKKS
jgi:molecular chaperone GrpE